MGRLLDLGAQHHDDDLGGLPIPIATNLPTLPGRSIGAVGQKALNLGE